MTVRAARTFAGYQALFCDRLGRADFLKLSPEAVGLLFMLRLLADRAILMSRGTSNHGKIWDDQAERWWVGADAEAWFADLHPARAQDVAVWMAELRRGGFVAGDFDEELVVSDFVEDDLRKAGNVRAIAFGERGGCVGAFPGRVAAMRRGKVRRAVASVLERLKRPRVVAGNRPPARPRRWSAKTRMEEAPHLWGERGACIQTIPIMANNKHQTHKLKRFKHHTNPIRTWRTPQTQTMGMGGAWRARARGGTVISMQRSTG